MVLAGMGAAEVITTAFLLQIGAGLPISIFSLAALLVIFAFVLAIASWVDYDAQIVEARREYWNTIIILSGLFWFVLIYLIPAFWLSVIVGGAIFTTGLSWYIYVRNGLVPANEKLFGKEHMERLWHRFLAACGFKPKPVTPEASSENRIEVQLIRGNGEVAVEGIAQADALQALQELVAEAVLARATDIHLEPKGADLHVRLRIDGVLHNTKPYPRQLGQSIVAALKVLSEMDIAEKRKPQDGNFSIRMMGRDIDVRSSTAISVHGEKMVLRLLDKQAGLLEIDSLGMHPSLIRKVKALINRDHGMLVVTGPTGSGKTTTLYAALGELDAFQKNIVTIEDPIEYHLENVTQTQISEKAGINFSGTLRHMLRQDPDVILVGEIRDPETAHTALEAATTGHFVFTTLHANDSVGAVFRLLDLGLEPYLVSVGLSAVLAQRLVRVLCENCRVPYKPQPEFLKKAGISPEKVNVFYKARGCEACHGTGFYGRTGLFEYFELDDQMKEMVRTRASYHALKTRARRRGMRVLVEDGMEKVIRGITSIKEVARVTR